jgi:hypothetical protein
MECTTEALDKNRRTASRPVEIRDMGARTQGASTAVELVLAAAPGRP